MEEAPEVSALLTNWGSDKIDEGEEWPEEVMQDLFLEGLDSDEIITKWSGKEIIKRKRKRKESAEGEEDEEGLNGSHFIDDEAEEG